MERLGCLLQCGNKERIFIRVQCQSQSQSQSQSLDDRAELPRGLRGLQSPSPVQPTGLTETSACVWLATDA